MGICHDCSPVKLAASTAALWIWNPPIAFWLRTRERRPIWSLSWGAGIRQVNLQWPTDLKELSRTIVRLPRSVKRPNITDTQRILAPCPGMPDGYPRHVSPRTLHAWGNLRGGREHDPRGGRGTAGEFEWRIGWSTSTCNHVRCQDRDSPANERCSGHFRDGRPLFNARTAALGRGCVRLPYGTRCRLRRPRRTRSTRFISDRMGFDTP